MSEINNTKLKKLLSYWIQHNRQHTKEMEKWIKQFENTIPRSLIDELRISIKLFEEINGNLKSVNLKLQQSEPKSLNDGAKLSKKNITMTPTHKNEIQNTIQFKKIGTIHTPYKEDAPYQPIEEEKGNFKVVLNDEYKEGIYELKKFNYIFLTDCERSPLHLCRG